MSAKHRREERRHRRGSPPTRARAGLTQTTCDAGDARAPEDARRAAARGRSSSRRSRSPWRTREAHGGTCVKSPPALPVARGTWPPSRIAETSSRRCAGERSITSGQVLEHVGALRVPDQDDAAPVVVVREVVAPGREHVGVGEAAGGVERRRRQPAVRDLAVHRARRRWQTCENARGLRLRDEDLGRPIARSALPSVLVADGRIDVEAVDRRACRHPRLLDASSCRRRVITVVARLVAHGSGARPGKQSQTVFCGAGAGAWSRLCRRRRSPRARRARSEERERARAVACAPRYA